MCDFIQVSQAVIHAWRWSEAMRKGMATLTPTTSELARAHVGTDLFCLNLCCDPYRGAFFEGDT
jgi:hypothetical protein